MYAVIKEGVQFATLQWSPNDSTSFLEAFRALMDLEEEAGEPYDLVALALDLFSLKYAVLETGVFELKFVRLTVPAATG